MNEEQLREFRELIRVEHGKRENPYAFVRHFFRTEQRNPDFHFITDTTALNDLMQAEFGLVPDEVGELTPAASGILMKFRHRLRTAPTEVARKVVLAEIQNVRRELASLPDPDPVATVAFKALGTLLGICVASDEIDEDSRRFLLALHEMGALGRDTGRKAPKCSQQGENPGPYTYQVDPSIGWYAS